MPKFKDLFRSKKSRDKKKKHRKKLKREHVKEKKLKKEWKKGKGDSSIKLKGGKKYTRLQRFETLGKEQKKVLKELGKKVKPEKFKPTKAMKKAQKFLEKRMKKPPELSPAGKAGERFVERGLREGPPVSPIERTSEGFLQNILGRTPEQQLGSFEQPYMRQFQEQIVPEIAERFAGGDALRSSAFQQAMGAAGAGLSENLASLKGNLINQLLGQQTQAANVGLGYAQMPGQRYGLQQQMANLGLSYGQIPGQQFQQQMQAAQAAVPMSLLPQEAQQEMNRYAQGADFQRQQQILGTQPFGMMGIPPSGKAPSFWQGAAPRAIGALAGAGLGSLVGMPMQGAALGAGIMGASVPMPAPSAPPMPIGVQRMVEAPSGPMAGGS